MPPHPVELNRILQRRLNGNLKRVIKPKVPKPEAPRLTLPEGPGICADCLKPMAVHLQPNLICPDSVVAGPEGPVGIVLGSAHNDG